MTVEWICTVEPTIEPITLAEAKVQLRIPSDDVSNDGLVRSYLVAARQAGEAFMGRGFLTQTWKAALSDFAEVIYLPMAAPLQNNALASPSTAPVVQYYATDGTLTTLDASSYTVDTTSRPGSIARAPSVAWPALQADRRGGRVFITYVVGWTTSALVPERIKQGIRLMIGASDADREGQNTSATAAEACWIDRVYWKHPTEAPCASGR